MEWLERAIEGCRVRDAVRQITERERADRELAQAVELALARPVWPNTESYEAGSGMVSLMRDAEGNLRCSRTGRLMQVKR
jgi:hypothetical protein